MRIALFDTDAVQAQLICEVLTGAGHRCRHLRAGERFPDRAEEDGVDLLILHLDAKHEGARQALHLVDELPAPQLPILFIASRTDHDSLGALLGEGVRDYMLKPLRQAELPVRVQVLLRRAYPEQAAPEPLRFGDYLFDVGRTRASLAGQPIVLTHKEFELALLFFRHLGRPLSRAYIRETVWPREAEVPSRTLDTHVSRVRNKLQLRPENGFRLAPVYSYGYQLEQLPS